MTFRVGQKVVCVDARARNGVWFGDDTPPKRGQVYTVLRAGIVSRGGNPCVDLVEIRRPDGYHYGEWRFRPLVERKTDISIFTSMLKPSKVNA